MQQLLFNLRHLIIYQPNFIDLPSKREESLLLWKGPLLISKTAVLFNLTVNFSVFICVCSIFGFFFCFYNVSCCWSRCHEKICWNVESRTFIFVMICWNFSWVYNVTLKKQENKITLIHVELFVFDWDWGARERPEWEWFIKLFHERIYSMCLHCL